MELNVPINHNPTISRNPVWGIYFFVQVPFYVYHKILIRTMTGGSAEETMSLVVVKIFEQKNPVRELRDVVEVTLNDAIRDPSITLLTSACHFYSESWQCALHR